MFKKNKKQKNITPKKALKIASKIDPIPTTYQDCIDDIYLRAHRGRFFTIMQQVSDDVIDQLLKGGWKIQLTYRNNLTNLHTVKISWND